MNLSVKDKIEEIIGKKIVDSERDALNGLFQKSNLDRNEYIQIRNGYIVEANNSSNSFDKTIISLSMAALGVSAYFVNAKQYAFSYQWELLLGRFFLTFCLGITLYSFFLSEKVHKICLEKYDLEYEKDYTACLEKKRFLQKLCEEKDNQRSSINNKLQLIKKVSLMSLVLGVIILGIFFYSNINLENHSNFIYQSDYSYGNAYTIFFRKY